MAKRRRRPDNTRGSPTFALACGQQALHRLLGARGYPAKMFASAEDCLHAIQGHVGPACVLTELLLPGMDGLGLLRALPNHFPVVMLTGHADVRLAVRTMKSGAVDFLEKPLSENQLLCAIDSAVTLAKDRFTFSQDMVP